MNLLGQTHVMTIKGDLPPNVVDPVGTTLSIHFTSDKCQNAYISSYPINSCTYDVSLGSS